MAWMAQNLLRRARGSHPSIRSSCRHVIDIGAFGSFHRSKLTNLRLSTLYEDKMKLTGSIETRDKVREFNSKH